MASNLQIEKYNSTAESVEVGHHGPTRTRQTCYLPTTDREKQLDKQVNTRLDLAVVTLLALQFIVGSNLSVHHPG